MNTYTMENIFDPQVLADDLLEVQHIYDRLLAGLDETRWNEPVKGGPKEWTLHETLAHLCALNGAGLENIQHALRGEPYTFRGLENRYQLNAYNRKGIDEHLGLPMKALNAELLGILGEAASLARSLRPDQAGLTVQMSVYNRPALIAEGLSILIFHFGLAHAAQVAEPAGVPPLWTQFTPRFRHRMVGRVMRALSMLYRIDLGGDLRSTLAFRVDGLDGGDWHIDLSPESATSAEGVAQHAGLTIHLRDLATFYRMFTGRLNPPTALLTGQLKLRGDLRLFLRMNTLFSVDARPNTGQWYSGMKQWLYRGQRPNWIAKLLNRAWANAASKGTASNGLVALEVTGRKSGKIISFPLVMVSVEGQRYLASMLGDNTQWVRNVRASGGKAVLRNGSREEVQLEELPVDQRASILKAYLQAAPGARPHVPVDKDAPLAEFEKIAPSHPVFRLTSLQPV